MRCPTRDNSGTLKCLSRLVLSEQCLRGFQPCSQAGTHSYSSRTPVAEGGPESIPAPKSAPPSPPTRARAAPGATSKGAKQGSLYCPCPQSDSYSPKGAPVYMGVSSHATNQGLPTAICPCAATTASERQIRVPPHKSTHHTRTASPSSPPCVAGPCSLDQISTLLHLQVGHVRA